mmetsp:Transcript_19555/g.45468  ORF Transcript_19555/g.45468 Transcript_19555/m.45468 type:complete len:292 (+) Transcript_19555:57-932(+)
MMPSQLGNVGVKKQVVSCRRDHRRLEAAAAAQPRSPNSHLPRRRIFLLTRAIVVAVCGAVLVMLPQMTFTPPFRERSQGRILSQLPRHASPDDGKANAWDQLVWNLAEGVGNARAALVGSSDTAEVGEPASTAEELIERLRVDYDRNYFLTGDVDVPLYTQDCEFADPFTSFRGRDRFVSNLKNLAGGFITAFNVKLLDYEASSPDVEPLVVTSRLRVILELGLPWRPTLGWVWGVTHECGPQVESDGSTAWRCFLHRESWEIEPSKGVEMLFKPGRGLPAGSQEGADEKL